MYLMEGKEKIIIVWQLYVQIELKIIFDFYFSPIIQRSRVKEV